MTVDSRGIARYNTPMNWYRRIAPRASEKHTICDVTRKDVVAIGGKAIAGIVISPPNRTTLRRLGMLLSIVLVGQALAASPQVIELRQVTPALSDAVLLNPGMGL